MVGLAAQTHSHPLLPSAAPIAERLPCKLFHNDAEDLYVTGDPIALENFSWDYAPVLSQGRDEEINFSGGLESP